MLRHAMQAVAIGIVLAIGSAGADDPKAGGKQAAGTKVDIEKDLEKLANKLNAVSEKNLEKIAKAGTGLSGAAAALIELRKNPRTLADGKTRDDFVSKMKTAKSAVEKETDTTKKGPLEAEFNFLKEQTVQFLSRYVAGAVYHDRKSEAVRGVIQGLLREGAFDENANDGKILKSLEDASSSAEKLAAQGKTKEEILRKLADDRAKDWKAALEEAGNLKAAGTKADPQFGQEVDEFFADVNATDQATRDVARKKLPELVIRADKAIRNDKGEIDSEAAKAAAPAITKLGAGTAIMAANYSGGSKQKPSPGELKSLRDVVAALTTVLFVLQLEAAVASPVKLGIALILSFLEALDLLGIHIFDGGGGKPKGGSGDSKTQTQAGGGGGGEKKDDKQVAGKRGGGNEPLPDPKDEGEIDKVSGAAQSEYELKKLSAASAGDLKKWQDKLEKEVERELKYDPNFKGDPSKAAKEIAKEARKQVDAARNEKDEGNLPERVTTKIKDELAARTKAPKPPVGPASGDKARPNEKKKTDKK